MHQGEFCPGTRSTFAATAGTRPSPRSHPRGLPRLLAPGPVSHLRAGSVLGTSASAAFAARAPPTPRPAGRRTRPPDPLREAVFLADCEGRSCLERRPRLSRNGSELGCARAEGGVGTGTRAEAEKPAPWEPGAGARTLELWLDAERTLRQRPGRKAAGRLLPRLGDPDWVSVRPYCLVGIPGSPWRRKPRVIATSGPVTGRSLRRWGKGAPAPDTLETPVRSRIPPGLRDGGRRAPPGGRAGAAPLPAGPGQSSLRAPGAHSGSLGRGRLASGQGVSPWSCWELRPGEPARLTKVLQLYAD